MGKDNAGRNTSRIIVLYVDYHYQEGKRTSVTENKEVSNIRTQTESNEKIGNTIIREKETASNTKTKNTKNQTELIHKNINLTLISVNKTMMEDNDRTEKKQFDEAKYLALLNRQAFAHEKVAFYLALLHNEEEEIAEIRYKIEILQTRKKQLISH